MKSCLDFSDILVLDALEELDPEASAGLEKHLRTCHDCRQERQRLLNLLQRVREAMPAPELSEDEERDIRRSVASGLHQRPGSVRFREWAFRFPLAPLPALTVVFLIVIGLGWFIFLGPSEPPSIQSLSRLETEEQIIVQQLDLLENLDLLKEMETIQKLVYVVDYRDSSLTQQ